MKVRFLGATRQVTGSSFYLEAGGLRLMIDHGLFQERSFLYRNWEPCPVPVQTIDYLLLTHAHLDHSGRIPRLVKEGYYGPILSTPASAELARIVLLDSAKIQEEDALFKQKRHKREGRKVGHPVIPLYTLKDAEASLPLFRNHPYETPVVLNDRVTVVFHDAGHILGASMIEVKVRENGEERMLIFSGDVGQWDKPIIRDPSLFERADYVVMESTYGDRDHVNEDVKEELKRVINDTVERGGNVVIPTFAIERAQEVMYYLNELVREDAIPHLMVFLDSPMAVDVTDVFLHHRECMDDEARALFERGESPFRFPGMKLVRTVGESKAINRIKGSCVIMAGSGMCTGGRIKHHLVSNISNPRSTVVFVGYQANGTLGRIIVDGREEVRILGKQHAVRAKIEQIHGFSAHADRRGLLRWVGNLKSAPECVFVVHGEEEVALKFAKQVRGLHGWKVVVPRSDEAFEIA